jgi:hypothetical protein
VKTLDRSGIFKARPQGWSIYEAESGAVAIKMKLLILEELDGTTWTSWADYEEHIVYGDFYVIKKDGAVNSKQVEALVLALGWDGDLRSVIGEPPDCIVQVTVKPDEYKGTTRYKASWVNPEDFTPTPQGESEGDVKKLQSRFGSLLRAAASTVKPSKPAAKKPAPPPARAAVPAGGEQEQPGCTEGDDSPENNPLL